MVAVTFRPHALLTPCNPLQLEAAEAVVERELGVLHSVTSQGPGPSSHAKASAKEAAQQGQQGQGLEDDAAGAGGGDLPQGEVWTQVAADIIKDAEVRPFFAWLCMERQRGFGGGPASGLAGHPMACEFHKSGPPCLLVIPFIMPPAYSYMSTHAA